MIKVFVMSTCPDCAQVKAQLKGNSNYQLIDIGEHVLNLKQFLTLRDNNPAFDTAKANGSIGIPCFVQEDGTIKFTMEDVIIEHISHVNNEAPHEGFPESPTDGAACSLDGKGC